MPPRGGLVIKLHTLDEEYLSFFCAALGKVLEAGLPAGEGLSVLLEEEQDAGTRALLQGVNDALLGGATVHEALCAAGVFPAYLLDMVEIGERTGRLSLVFHRLAAYYEKQLRIRRMVRSAVAYPSLLLVIILAVLFVFLTEVLPVFQSVFAQLGATMPPAAALFLNIGIALGRAKWVLLGILAAVAAFLILCRVVSSVRLWAEGLLARVFGGGALGYKVALARFAAAMNLSYSGLSDMTEALELSARFGAGRALESRIARCRQEIGKGAGVAEAMAGAALFSAMDCRLLSIGVRTGRVDEVLGEIALHTEEDMDAAIDAAAGRVEPAVVLVLSLCVGLLLLTVMLPLVSIMSVI